MEHVSYLLKWTNAINCDGNNSWKDGLMDGWMDGWTHTQKETDNGEAMPMYQPFYVDGTKTNCLQ